MTSESDIAYSSQIFKNHIPNESLFELLEKICFKMENCYIFNVDAFKKGIYTEEIQKFLTFCRPYYFISRRKYLDRKLTYQSFATILRQICNYNKIIYSNEIKYDKSSYSMFYYVFFEASSEATEASSEATESSS
jgi:hypothetical protein